MSPFQSVSRQSSPVGEVVTLSPRLQLQHLICAHTPSEEELSPGSDVVQGLSATPKTLSPRYFYDDQGSQLFEAICELPEYYLTRTETLILQDFAEAIAHLTGPCEIVELGSGSSTKTRLLLDAYQSLGHPLRYVPIDVSAGILQSSAQALLQAYPTLQVQGLIGTYEQAIAQLAPTPLAARMICFIGSSLGNLDPETADQFFDQITAALQPGDYFLLGIDLQKPKAILETAYNDAQGVTAAFNLNMLSHLNRRFVGNFEVVQFEHWAFYNETAHQIEMHLRSRQAQSVRLEALDLTVAFEAGETVRTEISRKFDLAAMQQNLASHGLQTLHTWTDPQSWFGLVLAQR